MQYQGCYRCGEFKSVLAASLSCTSEAEYIHGDELLQQMKFVMVHCR